ncbi:protein of unknown function DUF328 [Beutenbergia cavernae DSM 12333]|uniref:Uncharacterized protein n=1 Tax=Beutenbergia cavernae (strain ATCC BAA-8 / DSM 12333 / CCUG 43141 / JCM 11478 / NBRC 16432 / NCIMB 13614 / HKI 0122) TaxID=471853 RepID=C5C4W2_BEUC1|nr:peroxide stress protein YaaA [Beutenbergia cavernae]ACQ80090.1 protein of unknown function DUF328 [Beutenbergia cavernae DSM 12333]
MLLVLPPSEGKTSAPRGAPPLDLDTLTFPGLTEPRAAVLDALGRVSAHRDALELLEVGASLADEVERNTRLRTAPAAPASRVYSGVLYAAAGLGRLRGPAAERAATSVVVISALFGALTPADRVPAYRLAMQTLPGLGPLAAHWRDPLAAALADRASGDVVVDCRSGPYVAAWRPPADADWLAVRVEQLRAGGRVVVSHHAKHTRGVLARHLLTRRGGRRAEPRDAAAVLRAARSLVGSHGVVDVELAAPSSRGRAATLTLVLGDL